MKLIRILIVFTLMVGVGMICVSNLWAFNVPEIPHQPPTHLAGDEEGAETTMEGGNKTITQTKTDTKPNKSGTKVKTTTVKKVRTENKDGSTRDETTTTKELTKMGKGKDGKPYKKTKTRTTTTTIREKDTEGNRQTKTTKSITKTTYSKPDFDGVQRPEKIEGKPAKTHITTEKGTEITKWTNRDGDKVTVKKFKDGRESKRVTDKHTGKYRETRTYPDKSKIEVDGHPNGVEYHHHYDENGKFVKTDTVIDGKVIKTSTDPPKEFDDLDDDPFAEDISGGLDDDALGQDILVGEGMEVVPMDPYDPDV